MRNFGETIKSNPRGANARRRCMGLQEPQLRLVRQLGLTSLELGIANAPMDLQADASEEAIENGRGQRIYCAELEQHGTVCDQRIRVH